jgi:putative sterol carrier protein
MKRLFMLCVLLPLFSLSLSSHYSGQKQKSAEEMIRDFAASCQEKAATEEKAVFGIEIRGEGGGEWSIQIGPERKVIVLQGKPEKPTFFFTTDLETLKKIYKGELNAMTAAGRARASESAPLDIKFMEGALPSPEILERILHYAFHFFVMGSPEIVFFGEENSRFVHGGNMVVFYYAKGLRTAWCQASLSSPFGRGTMPAQPSNGFLNTQPDPLYITDLQMLPKKMNILSLLFIYQPEQKPSNKPAGISFQLFLR